MIADRLGRKRALMGAILMYSIFTAACGFSQTVTQLAIVSADAALAERAVGVVDALLNSPPQGVDLATWQKPFKLAVVGDPAAESGLSNGDYAGVIRVDRQGDGRRDGAFTIFYMGINLGAFLSPLLCGWLADSVSYHWGFGAAGVGMCIGLLIFLVGQKRVLLDVAAAGNDGDDTVYYPAGYPEVVSVAATDDTDARADFSNANADVEIAAPGVDILSTSLGGGYETMSGTSMATPHVSAVAGVLRQVFPAESAAAIRSRLDAAVNDLGPAGRDASFGFGRVNLCKAAGGGC